MSLPTNNKKGGLQSATNQKGQGGKSSKFIKGAGAAKQLNTPKKIQKTGGNRGS